LGERKIVLMDLELLCRRTSALLMITLLVGACAKNSYPKELQKYIAIIEKTKGGGIRDFRTDVSVTVCGYFAQSDFDRNYGTYGDLTVRRLADTQYSIFTLILARQPDFMRGLLVQIDSTNKCQAFVEEY
jgi:hypothetical protein